MLTFQPRWVFEDLNDTTAFGRNMSKQIRKRLEAYDEVPIHPHLGWYGKKTIWSGNSTSCEMMKIKCHNALL